MNTRYEHWPKSNAIDEYLQEKNSKVFVNAFSLASNLILAIYCIVFLQSYYFTLSCVAVFGFLPYIFFKSQKLVIRIHIGLLSIFVLIGYLILYEQLNLHYFFLPLLLSTLLFFEKKTTLSLYSTLILSSFILLVVFFKAEPSNRYMELSTLILSLGLCTWIVKIKIDQKSFLIENLKQQNSMLLSSEKGRILAANKLNEIQDGIEQLDWVLSQKNAELQSYLDAIDLCIYSAITDIQGIIIKANDLLCSTTGYSREELIGQNFRILNSGNHDKLFFKKLFDTILAGKSWRGDIKNRNKNGSTEWLDMVIIPIKSKSGAINYFLALALPITNRRKLEKQQSEFVKTLEKVAFQTSHNIRGPLTRILGLSSLIKNNSATPDEVDFILKEIIRSSLELDKATSNLTAYLSKSIHPTLEDHLTIDRNN